MITIAAFNKAEDAHLLRMRLEAAGFSVFVQDEYLVQTDWLLANLIQGVKVQVPEDEVEAVRTFLQQDEPTPEP